jgi:hypothetical protein
MPASKKATPPEIPTYRSPLEKHSKHVRAIGMITVENSSLESLLADILALVIDRRSEFAFALYFSPKASSARLDLISNTLPIAYPNKNNQIRQRIEKIVNRSRKVMNKRNDIIHSIWTSDDGPTGVPIVAKISMPDWGGGSIDIQELYDIIKTYRSIIQGLLELFNELQPLSPEDIAFLEEHGPSRNKRKRSAPS